MGDRLVMAGYPQGWLVDGPGELRGRPLRYLLTTILGEAGGALTVRELVGRCEREGVVFRGRASKIVSDALRWEMSWGRVMRLGRGVYRSSRMPRSTRYWIAGRVRSIRGYLVGVKARAGALVVLSVLSQSGASASGPGDRCQLE